MIRRTLPVLLCLSLIGLFSPAASAQGGPSSVRGPAVPVVRSDDRRPRIDPHTVLVKFRSGTASAESRASLARHGMTARKSIPALGVTVVDTRGKKPAEAVAALRDDPSVEYAEPNHIRSITAAVNPNDFFFKQGNQNYLKTIRLPSAWGVTKGNSTLRLAVLDTGVRSHPDIGSRRKAGYNAINGGTNINDVNGHGTAVAATAAAMTNNTTGIAAPAWNASIVPVKVLNDNGNGNDGDIAEGIRWAADHGATVLNLSLGGLGQSQVLADAVAYALSKGKIVVASAGNSGYGVPSYPAAYPGVVAVTATDETSSANFASFSSFGPWVDVAAPGMNVVAPCDPTYPNNYYCGWYGTSFAAPLVSGIAILAKAKYPSYTPTNFSTRLKNTSRDQGPAGFDPFYGWGRVDAFAVVGGTRQAAMAPGAPDAFEPNNLPAQSVAVGASANPTISPEGDVDWFHHDVALSSGTLSVTAVPTAEDTVYPYRALEMDPAIAVYASDETTLLGSADLHPTGEPETVQIPITYAGRYHIVVWNFHGSRSFGTYALTVSAQGP